MRKYRSLDNLLWASYNAANRYKPKHEFYFPFKELLPENEEYRKIIGLPSLQDKKNDPYSKFYQCPFSDEEIAERMKAVWQKWTECHDFGQRRNGTTKDNDGQYVGSGNGRCSPNYFRGNRIRVPKKNRKNRMKQFLKLFPNFQQ